MMRQMIQNYQSSKGNGAEANYINETSQINNNGQQENPSRKDEKKDYTLF